MSISFSFTYPCTYKEDLFFFLQKNLTDYLQLVPCFAAGRMGFMDPTSHGDYDKALRLWMSSSWLD